MLEKSRYSAGYVPRLLLTIHALHVYLRFVDTILFIHRACKSMILSIRRTCKSVVPTVWLSALRYCCVSSSAASFFGWRRSAVPYTPSESVTTCIQLPTRWGLATLSNSSCGMVAACAMTMASSQAFCSRFRACNTCALPSHFSFVSSLAFCRLSCSHYIYKLQLNSTREQCLVWLLVLVCRL